MVETLDGIFTSDLDFTSIEDLYSNYSDVNSTDSTNFNDTEAKHWIYLIVKVFYLIMFFVGLFGNSLVIYVVLRFSKMQTVTNIYIVNLAIADLCVSLIMPFLLASWQMEHWVFGRIVCKAVATLNSLNQVSSSMFLVIMSEDRYLAMVRPEKASRLRTPLISKFVSLIAWILSAIIVVPVYLYCDTIEVHGDNNKVKYYCMSEWPNYNTWNGEFIFSMYSFVISYAVPLALITRLCALGIWKLKIVGPKHSEISPTPEQIAKASNEQMSQSKDTKLVATVILVHFLCWAPHSIVRLWYDAAESDYPKYIYKLLTLAQCLTNSTSIMNPVLYPFLSDNFKKTFLKVFCCKTLQFESEPQEKTDIQVDDEEIANVEKETELNLQRTEQDKVNAIEERKLNILQQQLDLEKARFEHQKELENREMKIREVQMKMHKEDE